MADLETITQKFETDTRQTEAALDAMQRELQETGKLSRQNATLMIRAFASIGPAAKQALGIVQAEFIRTGTISREALAKADRAMLAFGATADQVGTKAAGGLRRSSEAAMLLRGALSGLGVIFSVRSLVNFVSGTVAFAAAIEDVAEASGVSAQALQQWRFAGEQSGLTTNEVDQALGRFNQRLGQFTATGRGPAKNAFIQLGLSSKLLSGELKGTESALRTSINILSEISDPAERAAIAAGLFGEEMGPRLAALLAEGEAGIQALIDQAPLLTDAQTKAAREIEAEWQRVMANVRTTAQSFIIDMIRTFGGGGGLAVSVEDFIGEAELIDALEGAQARARELASAFGETSIEAAVARQEVAQLRAEMDAMAKGRTEKQGFLEVDIRQASGFELEDLPPTKAPKPTFADIIGPLEQENALLEEGLLTREQIQAILRAEKTLERELTDVEEKRLGQAVLLNKVVGARDTDLEKQFQLSIGQTEKLQEQVEVAQLLNEFGGVETAEYERQLGLLRLKHAGVGEITDEQRSLNAELVKERQIAEQQAALGGQRQERGQIGRERQFMGENLFAQEFTGLPAEEFRVQEQLGQLRNAGTQVTPDLEQSIRQTERMRTELGFMETAATAAGGAMTDLATESLFGEGPEEAARRFTAALAEMALQAALTQLAVLALNAAMGGTGTGATTIAPPTGAQFGAGNTTGAGGAGFSYASFGGPRQHGGPVSAGSAYIVGERGSELFVPKSSGAIVPHGAGAKAPTINVYNESNAKVDVNTDIDGIIDMRIRSSVNGMGRDGSMHRMVGARRPGIARG